MSATSKSEIGTETGIHRILKAFARSNFSDLEGFSDTNLPAFEDIETFSRDLFLGNVEIGHLSLAKHQQSSQLSASDLTDAKRCATALAEIVIPNTAARQERIAHVNQLFNRGLLPLFTLVGEHGFIGRISELTKLSSHEISRLTSCIQHEDSTLRSVTVAELFQDYLKNRFKLLTPTQDAPIVRSRPQRPAPETNEPIKATQPKPRNPKRRKDYQEKSAARLEQKLADIRQAEHDLSELEILTHKLLEQARAVFKLNRDKISLEGENFTHRFLSMEATETDDFSDKLQLKIYILSELELNCKYLSLLEGVIGELKEAQYFDPSLVAAVVDIYEQHKTITDEVFTLYDLTKDFKDLAHVVMEKENKLKRAGAVVNVTSKWQQVLSARLDPLDDSFIVPDLNAEWHKNKITAAIFGVPQEVINTLRSSPNHWIGKLLSSPDAIPTKLPQHDDPVNKLVQYWLFDLGHGYIFTKGFTLQRGKNAPKSLSKTFHSLNGQQRLQLDRCRKGLFSLER